MQIGYIAVSTTTWYLYIFEWVKRVVCIYWIYLASHMFVLINDRKSVTFIWVRLCLLVTHSSHTLMLIECDFTRLKQFSTGWSSIYGFKTHRLDYKFKLLKLCVCLKFNFFYCTKMSADSLCVTYSCEKKPNNCHLFV